MKFDHIAMPRPIPQTYQPIHYPVYAVCKEINDDLVSEGWFLDYVEALAWVEYKDRREQGWMIVTLPDKLDPEDVMG